MNDSLFGGKRFEETDWNRVGVLQNPQSINKEKGYKEEYETWQTMEIDEARKGDEERNLERSTVETRREDTEQSTTGLAHMDSMRDMKASEKYI